MRKFYSIFALCAFLFLSITVQANNVTVDNWNGTDTRNTTYLPIAINTGTGTNCAYHSVSQQLYYASELSTASSTSITAITFYYTSGTNFTRKLRVWMNDTDLEDFPTPSNTSTPNMVSPGTKVFSGDVELTAGSPYTITFDKPYSWDGTSNIIVTVFDSTGIKNNSTNYGVSAAQGQTVMFGDAGKVRFLHKTNIAFADFANAEWTMDNLSSAKANSISVDGRKYVNKITFTFGAAPEPPATPTDLSVSAAITSATLSWSGVLGATSYDLQQSADGESWSTLSSGETGTSFNWTGLSAASTQFARIRANNAVGSSEWSSAVIVTTDAVHEHNDITFEKWSSTNSLPTSGNYYIKENINFAAYATEEISLTGNLNLCLNGKLVNIEGSKIIVPSGVTFTLFDNVGGGKITSFFAGSTGEMISEGLITVQSGGTLILGEGAIENTYITDEDGTSIAICNQGTLKLSGAPNISSNDIDIYLGNNSNITIESGKPLTNSTPYKVSRLLSGTFTNGWANMSGANPSNHFASVKAGHGIGLSGGEAAFLAVLSLDENSDNNESTLSSEVGQTHNVAITRSLLTNESFNTICLPFALDNDQLEDIFGAGYDLEKLTGSSLDGDELTLTFDKVTALEAGKPYLLQPANNVTNPSFEGVTIGETAPVDIETSLIDFKGTFNPTDLEVGNHNILCLGASNSLFWPNTSNPIKGFRAYFEVKGDAKKAKAARIVKKEDQTQAIDNIENPNPAQKRILNGQLVIEKNGTFYNAQGQIVK